MEPPSFIPFKVDIMRVEFPEDTIERRTDLPKEADHGTVGEMVYGQIRNDILLGQLLPGAKLKLNQLKQDYDVSVNTLRETLARLSADGLVEAEGQKGFRVVPVSIADLREITEMRQLIECFALRKSIENGGLDWEGRLVSAHHMLARSEKLMMKTPDDAKLSREWQLYDREFHAALISACNSNWILRVHKVIHDQFRRYQMLALKTNRFRGEELEHEHRMIQELALNRDAEAATELLAAHIRKGAEVPVNEMASAKR